VSPTACSRVGERTDTVLTPPTPGAPWMEGAAWFHDTLVDADLAINSMMWQNAGRTGMDPWSFSISPISRHQDPSAAYVRAWVPELARLPNKFVHEPWKAPAAVLEEAGVVLGDTYPCRVVTDLAAAKTRAAASVHAVCARARRFPIESPLSPADQGTLTCRLSSYIRIRVMYRCWSGPSRKRYGDCSWSGSEVGHEKAR